MAPVNTGVKPSKQSTDPRQTRYGFLPIWAVPTMPRAFSVWEIPANKVFPFRPFIGEVGTDANGRKLYEVERMPNDQVLDMYVMSPNFLELSSLAKLDDEVKAAEVAAVVSCPIECTKYPHELNTMCATCWLEDLRTNVHERIKDSFQGQNDCMRAANGMVQELIPALENAISEARRILDKTIREVDDPKNGKDEFTDNEMLCVYHTHGNRPTYRTTTSGMDIGTQIAEALKAVAAPSAPAVDTEMIRNMISEAVATETSALREKLAEYEAAEQRAKPEGMLDHTPTAVEEISEEAPKKGKK